MRDYSPQAQVVPECLLVWAGEPHAVPPHSNALLWDGTSTGSSVRSIRDLVEEHAEEVRRRYLAWCHEFGETTAAGRPVRECFAFADGTSLWSQSVFVEQSAWRQRSLEPILKITAFELLLERMPAARVHFVGADGGLAETLRRVCRRHGVEFEWTRLRRSRRLSAASLVRALPQTLQGLLMLLYLLPSRLRLAAPGAVEEHTAPGSGNVLIAGPFFNFDVRVANSGGVFTSRFWTVLPAVLAETGLRITWLQTFYRHEEIPSPRAAARVMSRINQGCGPGESHVLLDAYLTLTGAARVARRWFAAAVESWHVARELERRQALDPVLRYWPLLRHDWARAFRGVLCVEGLLYAECYDRALRALPHQHEGLYLMEGQGWERALAAAWRRHGHGRLAGVVHSTIRFWDLRYHADPRRYAGGTAGYLAGPDVVICNGRVARAAYLSTAAVRESLVDCEALRYLHLTQKEKRERQIRTATLRILVVGDFTPAGTAAVLDLMETARTQLQIPLEVRMKAHPNCPVQPAQYPRLDLVLLPGSVAEQSREVEVVLAANLTSAAVDAYASGARVLIYDDGVSFNYSPLRGMPGVLFVRTAQELCVALHAAGSGDGRGGNVQNEPFFNIDTALPCWRAYLRSGESVRDRREAQRAPRNASR
jgi:surface carbohydrate biosynthesis protein (TIGR04326 family)